MRIWFKIFISGKKAGFRHESLLNSFGENRIFHSYFRGVNQIMKQPARFLFFFSVPWWIWIIITRNFKYIFFVKKLKKKTRPLLFFQFLAKKNYLNFWVIMIEIHWGILKKNKNVASCFIIWLNPPKMRIKNASFTEWAKQAFMSEPCHLPGWIL